MLTADGWRTLTITTGDKGTEVLDAVGRVVGSHGSDRHDELVERHRGKDGAPPPSDDDGIGDGFRELDLGNTG